MQPSQTQTRFRIAELPPRKPTRFELIPDESTLTAMAEELGIDGLRKVRLTGEIAADGKTDWRLNAQLGATVVQPCVVTLAPVTTRIEEEIERRYLAEMPEPTGEESEMPEDDRFEPLPDEIDLMAVLFEALALALPPYPRADGAELGEAVFTEPGKEAMKDADLKPFAGLEALKAKLTDKPDES